MPRGPHRTPNITNVVTGCKRRWVGTTEVKECSSLKFRTGLCEGGGLDRVSDEKPHSLNVVSHRPKETVPS